MGQFDIPEKYKNDGFLLATIPVPDSFCGILSSSIEETEDGFAIKITPKIEKEEEK